MNNKKIWMLILKSLNCWMKKQFNIQLNIIQTLPKVKMMMKKMKMEMIQMTMMMMILKKMKNQKKKIKENLVTKKMKKEMSNQNVSNNDFIIKCFNSIIL